MNDSKLQKDYQSFLNSDNYSPPKKLDNKILSFVEKDLDPSHLLVFSKLLGIQAFIGLLTMLFCPQFNLSLTNSYDLFHYFHYTFGENICMMICGSIFLGTGAIFASYVLNYAELKKIHRVNILYYMSLSILAISVFMLLGAKLYLNLLFYWFLGATISGVILFEINRVIRNKFLIN